MAQVLLTRRLIWKKAIRIDEGYVIDIFLAYHSGVEGDWSPHLFENH